MASYTKMGCCGTPALGQLDEAVTTAITTGKMGVAATSTDPDWTKLFFTSTLAGLTVYLITRALAKKE